MTGAGHVIECGGLGKRYRRTWALRDCRLGIPAGRVTALVGPNGAGKTTLLHLAAGLAAPTEGAIAVLGGLRPGSAPALERIGFVAQHTALYPGIPVGDLLRMGRGLNRVWDDIGARARLAGLGIPLERKFGRLSGGQQSQVALALALAKRPELLILDEPLAALDPLARHEFMAVLMTAVAEDGISVLFSSHLVAELEQTCDHLIVLAGGRVQVAGDVDDLLDGHRLLTGPTAQAAAVAAGLPVVRSRAARAQTRLLVRAAGGLPLPPGWQQQPIGLEELVLSYLREPGACALSGPHSLVTANDNERALQS